MTKIEQLRKVADYENPECITPTELRELLDLVEMQHKILSLCKAQSAEVYIGQQEALAAFEEWNKP